MVAKLKRVKALDSNLDLGMKINLLKEAIDLCSVGLADPPMPFNNKRLEQLHADISVLYSECCDLLDKYEQSQAIKQYLSKSLLQMVSSISFLCIA